MRMGSFMKRSSRRLKTVVTVGVMAAFGCAFAFGAAGLVGTTGENGLISTNGLTGVIGENGETGLIGTDGETGLTGLIGENGLTGVIGAEPAYAAEGDLIEGTYKYKDVDVPYRVTSDYVLIIGEENVNYVTLVPSMINSIEGLDKTKVTGFRIEGTVKHNGQTLANMLNGFTELRYADLSGLDTSSVKRMTSMFKDCFKLEEIDLSAFDTTELVNMSRMFENCISLRKVDISSFVTKEEFNSVGVFSGCESLQEIALGERTTFIPNENPNANPPSRNWKRYKMLDGTAASGPSMKDLTDYDGKSPGWYVASNVPAREIPKKVVLGTIVEDYFGESAYAEDMLISPDDPAGTEYAWEKVAGEGALEGGALSGPNLEHMTFVGRQAGEVTIRLTAKHDGQMLRSVRRTYQVVNAGETFSLSAKATASGTNMYNLHPNDEFTISINTWKTEGLATEATPEDIPGIEDFAWSVKGKGEVEFVSQAGGGASDPFGLPTFTFRCVNLGPTTITVSAKDGSWSEDVAFWVYNPEVDRLSLPKVEIYSGELSWLKDSYNGSAIGFFCGDWETLFDHYKAKRDTRIDLDQYFRGVSWDESIATTGRCYWDKPLEWDGDIVDYELPLTIYKPGKLMLSIVDTATGEELMTFTVNISEKVARSAWENDLGMSTIQYGTKTLTVKGRPGDAVSLQFAGKAWNDTIPESGKMTFSDLPIVKTGTSGKLTFKRSDGVYTCAKTVTVRDTKASVKSSTVKKTSKKMTVTVTNAKAGDKVKIKAGTKTYTKKITADKATFKYTQKIKKQKKGKKIKITVFNKFNQVRCTKTIKVK